MGEGFGLVSLPVSGFRFSSLVCMPPSSVGGNHKHPRVELLGLLSGSTELTYVDDTGFKQSLLMDVPTACELTLYLIPHNLPHAVKNISTHESLLIEFASEEQHDIESVVLV